MGARVYGQRYALVLFRIPLSAAVILAAPLGALGNPFGFSQLALARAGNVDFWNKRDSHGARQSISAARNG